MVFEWVPGPRDCLTYWRRRRASIGSLLRTKDFQNEMVIDEVSVPFYYALPFSPRALRLHGGLRRIESRYQVTPSASLLLCTFPRVSASLISISVCEFFFVRIQVYFKKEFLRGRSSRPLVFRDTFAYTEYMGNFFLYKCERRAGERLNDFQRLLDGILPIPQL